MALITIGSTSGFVLDFVDVNVQSLSERYSDVHFFAGGNDFGSAFFWYPVENVSPAVSIDFAGDTVSCEKRVRGLYYNNQRGQRLWPLDEISLASLQSTDSSYNDLSMTGRRYTVCSGTGTDAASVYGQISYDWNGTTSYLVAGTNFLYTSNTYDTPFADSFQYLNFTLPLGYIFDSNGGVGFLGGYLTDGTQHRDVLDEIRNGGNGGGRSISDIFLLSGTTVVSSGDYGETQTQIVLENGGALPIQNSFRGIAVQGTVGLGGSISTAGRQSLQGNIQGQNQVINLPSVTSATLINTARQRAQQLCRGRTAATSVNDDGNTLCFYAPSYDDDDPVIIDLLDTADYENKTIIVQNRDVVLENGMQDGYPVLDLFVDRGLLYIDTNSLSITFDGNGFPSSGTGATRGVFLQGNLIINGLIVGGDGSSPTSFAKKLYIHGKFTSQNTPLAAPAGRIALIRNMFDTTAYDTYIPLLDVFTWECDTSTGSGDDNASCDASDDEYALFPLIIIDRAYTSDLVGN